MFGFGWLAAVRAFFVGVGSEASIVRSAAPSTSTVIVVILLLVGGWAGFRIGSWWTASSVRSEVNAEWRAKIAAQNPAVKSIVAAGDAEGEVIDNEVIKEIGDTYAKLKAAVAATEKASRGPTSDRCSVPADCLRQ